MNNRIGTAILAGAALFAASGMAVAQERQGEHPMEGEIVAIDHDTGVILVNTQPVPMSVHFPADAVADLSVGDRITVHLAFEVQQ